MTCMVRFILGENQETYELIIVRKNLCKPLMENFFVTIALSGEL